MSILMILNSECFIDLKCLLFAPNNKKENIVELQKRDESELLLFYLEIAWFKTLKLLQCTNSTNFRKSFMPCWNYCKVSCSNNTKASKKIFPKKQCPFCPRFSENENLGQNGHIIYPKYIQNIFHSAQMNPPHNPKITQFPPP